MLFSCCSSPWPRKEFDWNGDVATRVDCVPQRLNSLRNIYPKGWIIQDHSSWKINVSYLRADDEG